MDRIAPMHKLGKREVLPYRSLSDETLYMGSMAGFALLGLVASLVTGIFAPNTAIAFPVALCAAGTALFGVMTKQNYDKDLTRYRDAVTQRDAEITAKAIVKELHASKDPQYAAEQALEEASATRDQDWRGYLQDREEQSLSEHAR